MSTERQLLEQAREGLIELLNHCAAKGWWLQSHAVRVMDTARNALGVINAHLSEPQAAAQPLKDEYGWPYGDPIARSKRILAAVDTYVQRPDQMNRSALRCMLVDEFTDAGLASISKAAKPTGDNKP